MKRLILALTLVVGAWPATSQAAPLFFDDFNSENGGAGQLNYTGFQKWDVLPGGGVDLIPLPAGGNGPYDFLRPAPVTGNTWIWTARQAPGSCS